MLKNNKGLLDYLIRYIFESQLCHAVVLPIVTHVNDSVKRRPAQILVRLTLELFHFLTVFFTAFSYSQCGGGEKTVPLFELVEQSYIVITVLCNGPAYLNGTKAMYLKSV